MKRFAWLFVIGLLLCAVSVSAGVKRLTVWQDQKTVVLDGADSTGWRYSDRFQLRDDVHEKKYDWLIAELYAPPFGEVDSTIAGEGVIDTIIWVVKAQFGQGKVVELFRDTSTLADTSYFEYFQYLNSAGDTSATGVWLYTGLRPALLYDEMWIEYRMADTAGSRGAIQSTIRWKFLFGED